MAKCVVYTEIIEGKNIDRWYYGTYDYHTANEVALELGSDRAEGIYHCVCDLDEVKALRIKNLPDWMV